MLAYLKRVPRKELEKCKEDADYAREYVSGTQPDSETLNLKESWDGLHYLLSANRRRPARAWDTMVVFDTSDLLGVALLGKEIMNRNFKYGFGNPKWIEPMQVKDIDELLSDLEWATLAEELVSEKMEKCGVWPENLWADETQATKYLQYWFLRLIKFYQTAASQNQAIICYLKM